MLMIWGVPILANIKDIIDVMRLEIQAGGLNLLKDMDPTNKNVMVTCPFHGDGVEKKPSLGISTAETTNDLGKKFPPGTVHCFTCGYKADLPIFISNVYGHNDMGMFGYKWITARYAAVQIDKRRPLQLNMSREKTVDHINYISEEELDSYRVTHPYMYYRKLNDKVINYFDVGFDSRANALTFPVHDLNGNVPFIQRRAVEGKNFLNADDVKKGGVIYGLYHVYQNLSWIKELILCESIIDALTCWTHRSAGVASLGVTLTETQLKLLRDVPVRKIISGYDADAAGQKGNKRLKEGLGKNKILQKVLFPPNVKDINEMDEEQFLNRRYGSL